MKSALLALVVLLNSSLAVAKSRHHTICELALATPDQIAVMDPAELFGDLFHEVQVQAVFEDSKYFPDMTARYSALQVMQNYVELKPKSVPELRQFVSLNFDKPGWDKTSVKPRIPGITIDQFIYNLWDATTQKPKVNLPPASSFVEVDEDYIGPGARFEEDYYYWDTHFTALGLIADGKIELFQKMVRIFSKNIMKYGRVFNGNRDYYRSRSQPPFFAMLVAQWQDLYGAKSAAQFLPALKKEHAFWMSGGKALQPGQATSRVVKLPDGSLLNRFWDDKDTPRPEGYKEDIRLAKIAWEKHRIPPEVVYRQLRAGAETGWDYSPRWLGDPKDFSTIQVTSLLPIDLNSELHFLEMKIAELSTVSGDSEVAAQFKRAADRRYAAIQKYMVDPADGLPKDYNWEKNVISRELSIATTTPMFVGIATPEQAARIAHMVESKFLKAGGVLTTLEDTDLQWSGKNGWAPLQWMTYAGLMRYGYFELAERLRLAWRSANEIVFAETGEMKEKYDVVNLRREATGGEYKPLNGFGGWSSGVYKAMGNPKASLRYILGGS